MDENEKILSLINAYQNDCNSAKESLLEIAEVLDFEYCRGHNQWHDGSCEYCDDED